MKIIAVSGWAQSGKDTLANHLISKYGQLTRVSFADSLKQMTANIYNIDLSYCYDNNLKEKPLLQYPVTPKDQFSLQMATMLFDSFRDNQNLKPVDYYIDPSGTFLGISKYNTKVQLYWTARALLILEGSIKRSVNSNYWVEQTINQIKQNTKVTQTDYVITDLRFKNEVEQLRQAFGKNLQIVRINRWPHPPSRDPSENDMNDYVFDLHIDNYSTLQDYYNNIDNLKVKGKL